MRHPEAAARVARGLLGQLWLLLAIGSICSSSEIGGWNRGEVPDAVDEDRCDVTTRRRCSDLSAADVAAMVAGSGQFSSGAVCAQPLVNLRQSTDKTAFLTPHYRCCLVNLRQSTDKTAFLTPHDRCCWRAATRSESSPGYRLCSASRSAQRCHTAAPPAWRWPG